MSVDPATTPTASPGLRRMESTSHLLGVSVAVLAGQVHASGPSGIERLVADVVADLEANGAGTRTVDGTPVLENV
jgi:hypothetical protein